MDSKNEASSKSSPLPSTPTLTRADYLCLYGNSCCHLPTTSRLDSRFRGNDVMPAQAGIQGRGAGGSARTRRGNSLEEREKPPGQPRPTASQLPIAHRPKEDSLN